MRYGTGVALVVAAGLLWSSQGLIFRQIDAAGPWAIMFWRSLGLLPVIVLVLVVMAARADAAGRAQLFAALRPGVVGWLGALGLVGAFAGAIYAIQITTIANAVFLFSATPFLAALIGWGVLGERVPAATWGAIALALLGIFVMVRGGPADATGGAMAGNVAALVSALGFAVFTVSLRAKGGDDPLPMVMLGALLSLVVAAVMSVWTVQTLSVPLGDRGWAIFMGAVTLAGGMILYSRGSRVVPAAQMALLANIEVLLGPLLVWLVLGETAGRHVFLGGAILVVAVTLNGVAGARRHHRVADAPPGGDLNASSLNASSLNVSSLHASGLHASGSQTSGQKTVA